jgi:ABC-2 type transport system permease protein
MRYLLKSHDNNSDLVLKNRKMKHFIGFVKKEFLHIIRDFRTLMLLFLLPVAMILIFGYVIRNEILDVKIAVLDNSKDEVTREITGKILSSDFFLLYENIYKTDDIHNTFKKGRIKEIIIFEPDFGMKLEKSGYAQMQLLADASDPNSASLSINYTQGIIINYLKGINKNIEQPLRIIPRVRMMYNPELKSSFMFVPGTMAMILMLVSALLTSISIVREKESGTMETLLVSPLKPIQIVLGKVTPYVILSVVNAITIILLGYYVFGLPVRGSFVLLLAESILFITLALSLGIFISTFSNSQQVAMFISVIGLMLPTILLSGFIFPIENMPVILQWLSCVVPPTYFISIIRNIMLKGTDFSYIWFETLVIAGITLLFITLSIIKFKTRLE